MKKPTFSRIALTVSLLFFGMLSYAQNYVPFTPRFDQDIKGDIILIGNNILGPDNNAFNDNFAYNHNVDMKYIDIDGDASTFSSSSADLEIPNPNCYEIKHASLYWGAVTSGNEPITNVRFKGPTGGYNDVVGTIIYDANGTAAGQSFPYSCYADVTSIVTGLANNTGTYTVANISSAEGETSTFNPYNGTGLSAGWSLFVVYEDPTLPGKSITSFDGFSVVRQVTGDVDIPISGFRTLPAPAPVRANFAFATLEGDSPITGDHLKVNGVDLSTLDRPADNFFNSSVTQLSALPVNNRVPNSTNTLGFDTGIIAIPNPGNSVIANDATSAIVTLETDGDTYFQYFFAFAVEIIEPNIVLTKIVEDDLGNDIGNQIVDLGQSLNYIIGFQNTGNDNATSFTIRDILPINIVFDYPTGLVLPAGVTVASYDPITREIIFNVENYLVEENDPVTEIRIEVQVVETCNQLADACSNIINNQAFATYQGTTNPDFIITDDPSFSSNTGCLLTPQATNFLADLDDCAFAQNEILCGASLEITAANGYDSYSWSTSPTGTPVIGTTQTITVTEVGTYYVYNTANAPCQSIVQEFVVTHFGGEITNPVIPFADEVVTCPNDGKLLPNIFLCGANDYRDILTNIAGASSIIWEQLDESSCTAVSNPDCANESDSCTWNQVGTGSNFTANTAGQFRLTINFSGGCFVQFYFNVYQNLLNPTVTATDIICTTSGSITVGGVPSGYEYSLDAVNYQTSNVFSISTAGIYTVYIKQIGVPTNPCIFSVPDIQIRERDFTVSTIVTQPLCNGDKGDIQLAANDVEPQYFFSLYNGATLINSVGPIVENNYEFANLNPGTYTATVETEDGCTYTEDITIIEPPLLTATAAITSPLTCTDGEITVYPVGGTPPYFYFVNSTTDFQTVPEIAVTTTGVYDITVVDSNNCSANTSITVDVSPAPEFNITTTDILCADSGNTGALTINVTNANGNSLQYSIDNGVTFFDSPVFTALTAGDYNVVVQYTTGSSICVTVPQTVTITANSAISGTAELTTNYTCTTSGSITVTGVTGGTSPYAYSIDGVTFQTGNSFSGLTAGTYTITIQDANDCTFITNEITIAPLNPPTDLTFSNSPLTCPTNTSTVTITGTTDGFGTLEYQIIAPAANTTAYQASNIFTGLAPGTYTFQVKDANDCIYSESYTITPLPALVVEGQNINDITCFGDSDGSVQFIVSGSSTFNYTINGGTSISGTSPIVLTGLAAGIYTIDVTDTMTNCETTATLTVNEPASALAITTTVTPITCIENGSIVINATGGWGGNTYGLTLPDGTILPSQTNNVFVNLSQSGTYTATATDTNGCTVESVFDLNIPNIPIASISTTSDFCYDATNGATLEVSVSSGQSPYEYNINGGTFQTNNIFTNLVPGNYTVTVRDAYGCEVILPVETIEPQLTINTVITKDLDCTASPDAIITGTISGGSAPFTYSVSINGGTYTSLGSTGSPFTYTTPTDGTYQFQITDAQGCVAESGVTTINVISNPTATATGFDPTCFNGTNGEVQLLGAGGSGGYTFSFNGGAFTADSFFDALDAISTTATTSEYTYQVQDSNSCLSPIYIITLNNPTEVIASATISNNTNCSDTTLITVSASGGTGSGYTYSFNGSSSYTTSNTLTITNTASAQTIIYSVRDGNGCIDTETIDIPPYNPLTGMTFVNSNVITCNDATTDVTVTPINGVAPFSYEIMDPAPATSNTSGATNGIFTNLSSGDYTFQITDANGCPISVSHTIEPAINIAIAQTNTDQICFGSDDGTAIFTMTDVSSLGNFTYTLTPSAGIVTQTGNEVTVTNLPTGTYVFDIVDSSTGCSNSANVTIDSVAEINFTVSASNISCNNTISTISFPTLSGGTGGYTYAYVTSGNPAPANGDYSTSTTVDTAVLSLNIDVYIMDSNNCVVMDTVTIISDVLPTVSASVDNQCIGTGNNFTITATATGIPTLMYSIDGTNFQSSNTFTVVPGTYTITVKDGNGCETTDTVTVYPQLTLSASLDKDITCSLPQEAQVTLTANGGNTPSYTYEYSTNGGATYTNIPTNIFNTSTAGSYTFMVTDANGCAAITTTSIDLTTPVNPDITIAQTAFINCNGEETAAISITPDITLGQAPFVFDVINTTTGVPYGTQTSGLPAGNYTVTVTDTRGCTDIENISILQPDPILVTYHAVDISCNASGVSQGSVIIDNVFGGTGPYNYFVTGTNGYSNSELNNLGTTSVSFDVVDFGLYQINVVDANGCSVLEQNVLVASPPTDLDIVITSTVDCLTGGESVVSIGSTLSSAGPFFFSIYQGAISVYPNPVGSWIPEDAPGSQSATFTGLTPGVTYTFIVYDASTNCSYYEPATAPIPTNSTLTATAVSSNNITCTGNADGNVSFTINSVYATPTTVSYEIFDSLSLSTTGISGIGIVPAGGSLDVVDLGPLPFGNYYVLIEETVGSNTGCGIVTAPFNITESAIELSITASVSQNENCNALGIITAIAQDGTAPYNYLLLLQSDPVPTATTAGWASANTFNAAANSYTVYVMDAYGCIRGADVNLIRDIEPTIDPQIAPCFVGNPINITITGTVSIGSPMYSINGTSYSTNPNFTVAAPGTYTLYIQDANGCVTTTPYVVNDQLLLNATLTKELDCTASPDAEITLTATGGNSTSYTYEVSNDGGTTYNAMATNVYTATTAGTYTFSVTDASGCTSTTTYVLDPIQATTFTSIETNVSCNGGNDGSITVNVTSGTGPFSYQLDSGAIQNSNIFTSLIAGSYIITVIDSKSCTYISTPITISEPTQLTASNSISTNTSCDTATVITVLGQDGTPTATGEYYYDFNNSGFSTTNTYTVNNNGSVQTVNYIVRDANGCEVTGSITIDPLDPPTDLDFSATQITCLVSTSDVTLTATNGVDPLSYQILSPVSAITNVTGASSGIFTGLTPDNYIFQVTDANGCSYQELYTIEDVDNITVNGQLISDVTCNPGANGEVLFNISNFTGTYSYSINSAPDVTAQTNPTITIAGLTGPGTQTIVITDETTGCTATTSINVSQPNPLVLTLDDNINANCNTGAQVSVTATGGSGSYSYSFVVSGNPAGTYSTSNTAILDPTIATIWDVYVQDSNNCVVATPLTITIAMDPIPSGITITGTSQCPSVTNDYTFTVNVATGIMPYEYSIGNGFQTSPTFIVNASGTYNIIVKDGNGCTNTATYTIVPPLGLTPAITALPSCTNDDGELTITGSGGTGSYTYTISPNPAPITLTGNVFSGVPSGTYTVTITDTTTICSEDVTVTLDAATPVTFTTTVTDVNCNGDNNGVITVNLPSSNDNPIYTYEITAPITVSPQNSNIFTGLPAGTYTIQVNSGRGCSETANVTLGEPVLLEASATTTDFACAADNSVNMSTVTITELGGTAPYTYSINGINYFTTNTFDIIDTGSVQTINIFVNDTNGCIAANTVTINPLPTLTAASVAIVTPIDCNNTGTVAITVTGGSGNFTYQMLPDGLPQTSNIFNIATPGNYYFQVNDIDTGCTIATEPFTVDPFDTIEAIATATVAVSCFGDTSGEMELNINGYTGNYTYEVLDSSGNTVGSVVSANTTTNPQVITNLPAGNYTVEVIETDSSYCSTTSNVITITSPVSPLTLIASETSNVTCDNNQGTITAIGSGGTAPYEYELTGTTTVGYSSNGTFTNLAAGVYTINVKDAEQCITSANVTLILPTPINATFIPNTTLLSCFGDQTATITVSNITGGQGSNYTYTLNMDTPTSSASGPQTSNVFTGLGVGTYTITITDGYNCEFTSLPIAIVEPTPIQASLVTATTQTCLTESTLTLSAIGGTGPYTYSNSSDFTTVLGSFATATTFSVPVGTYVYYIKDANGCIANVSNDITIDPLFPLELNLASANPTINCAGDNTGTITATAQGGLGNYVYTLEDALGNSIPTAVQNSPGVFTELVAGTYVVTVDSDDCNTTSSTITITEPSTPLAVTFTVTDITCSGSNDGVLDINASGGSGIIQYAISPQLNQFFETSIFENLAPGTYDVIVQDQLGCYETFSFTLTEPIPVILSIVPDSIIPEICAGDNDGEFSIDISGGTTPYNVSLDDYNGVYTIGASGQTEFDFTELAGGDHIVYVRDDQGCESEWNITFPESVNINPIVVVDYLCVNNIASNTVTVTVDDSITNLSDLDYSLDGGPFQINNIFTDVVPGANHYIDVRHTNGCIQTTEFFDITQTLPLALALNEGELNEYIAITAGGSGDYQYTVNDENYGSTNTFIITHSGDYTITVTDSSGCRAVVSIYLEFIDLCMPNYFTPNNDGVTDGWTPGCAEHYPNLDFDIFDRYGRKVATLTVGEYWDGKYNDKELPTGDYWYVVRLNDSENDRNFVGHFTLYR